MSKPYYRDMWAVVFPDGHIVTGSDLQTEDDAWSIALGWPGPKEIDAAKKRGAFAVKARLRYYLPNDALCESAGRNKTHELGRDVAAPSDSQQQMTTQEHLTKIRARCVELLAISEKRTQGGWTHDGYIVRRANAGRIVADVGPHHTPPSEYPLSCKREDEANAIFIASCAGNFEAALRITIAAIDAVLKMQDTACYDKGGCKTNGECDSLADAILAAWPEELL